VAELTRLCLSLLVRRDPQIGTGNQQAAKKDDDRGQWKRGVLAFIGVDVRGHGN